MPGLRIPTILVWGAGYILEGDYTLYLLAREDALVFETDEHLNV
jgi:hypothetical protein